MSSFLFNILFQSFMCKLFLWITCIAFLDEQLNKKIWNYKAYVG